MSSGNNSQSLLTKKQTNIKSLGSITSVERAHETSTQQEDLWIRYCKNGKKYSINVRLQRVSWQWTTDITDQHAVEPTQIDKATVMPPNWFPVSSAPAALVEMLNVPAPDFLKDENLERLPMALNYWTVASN